MKVDVLKLKEKINEKNLNPTLLADSIGMNRSTLYRKLRANGETFAIGEAYRIAEVLPLTYQEAIDIFFSEQSHKCD